MKVDQSRRYDQPLGVQYLGGLAGVDRLLDRGDLPLSHRDVPPRGKALRRVHYRSTLYQQIVFQASPLPD